MNKKYNSVIVKMFDLNRQNKYLKLKENIKEIVKQNRRYTSENYINMELERAKMIIEDKKTPYLSILMAIFAAVLPIIVSAGMDICKKTSDQTVYIAKLKNILSNTFEISLINNSNLMEVNGIQVVFIGYCIVVMLVFGFILIEKEKEFECYSIYVSVLEELSRGDGILSENIKDNQFTGDYSENSFWKKYKKIIIVSALIVFGLVPIVIQYLIINNNFFSKATNDGWTSFWGSYLGGIFGGIGTLIAVIVTTRQAKRHQEENLRETQRIQNENNQYIHTKDFLEDVKRNKPLLILNERDLSDIFPLDYRLSIGKVNINHVELFEIQNVGLGLATDICIYFELDDGRNKEIIYKNIFTKDKVIKNYSTITPEFFNENIEGKIKKIKIKYKDIFGNIYTTIYSIEEYTTEGVHYLKVGQIKLEQKLINVC